MVSLSDFLTTGPDGFTTPDFGRLTQVGIGATFGALFTGLTSLVFGVFDIPIALLGGLGDFLTSVVAVVVGLPGVLVREGFLATWMFVYEAGPAGLPVALGIGLTAVFVFRWVVSRA
ncbi:hypothetical protein [Haloglomus litoreum]|uniref:hypothetical protein n=1 Tax=Haloglomus litoreum TaxID=3034026 RepID=UPI0023E8D502|nr:hypothetical protein [Haloglomus sp. DT116]